jgi:ubiquinone/menaquinone biosynthesis C-methylase UbiE
VATFPSEYIACSEALIEFMRVLRPHGKLIILPFAWITGDKWLEKLAAWLFQITGQVPRSPTNGEVLSGIHGQWIEKLTTSAQKLGFLVTFEDVYLQSSHILIIMAEKTN